MTEGRMTEPYFTWQTFEATLAGEAIRWAGKPGLEAWSAISPATWLLAEGLSVEPGQRVLDLRCGVGVCDVLAARRGADVTLCDDSCVAAQAARRTLELNGVPGQVIHGSVGETAGAAFAQRVAQSAPSFDIVLLDAPRGREWVRHLFGVAAHVLKPGGKLLLAGPTRGGIKGFIEDASEIVGPCQVTRIKAGHRLAVAERIVGRVANVSHDQQVCEAMVHGQPVRFATGPGVFSRGELDAGTRVLVETMVIRPGDTVLDLGCGCGVVGTVAARTARQVVLVDHSAAALAASRATLELNGVTNGTVLASDCAEAVRDRRFDIVATNPPFHQGLGVEFDVAQQFVRDAARVLVKEGGRLYLVANRFIRYERVMGNLFSQVTTAYEDKRFRVLEAMR
jgi:16S rRNA (guanine1207-N2)-methyltransferase